MGRSIHDLQWWSGIIGTKQDHKTWTMIVMAEMSRNKKNAHHFQKLLCYYYNIAICDSMRPSIVLSKSKLVKAWRKLALLLQQQQQQAQNVISFFCWWRWSNILFFRVHTQPCPSFIQTGNRSKPHVLQEPLLWRWNSPTFSLAAAVLLTDYQSEVRSGNEFWAEILNTSKSGRPTTSMMKSFSVFIKRSSSSGSVT